MEQKRETILADIVNAISLDIDCADVVVKMETVQEIIVDAEVDADAEYVSEISDDKLCIRYQWKLGAGRASLQETELDCERIRIETGAGKIRAGKVNKVSCGLGKVNIKIA